MSASTMALLNSSSLSSFDSNVFMLFCIAVANTDGKVPSGCGDDKRFVPMAILLKALDALVDDAVRIWDFIMRCILVSGGVSLLI